MILRSILQGLRTSIDQLELLEDTCGFRLQTQRILGEGGETLGGSHMWLKAWKNWEEGPCPPASGTLKEIFSQRGGQEVRQNLAVH